MPLSAAARFRYTLVAGTTAVVIGSGFTFVGLTRDAGADTSVSKAAAEQQTLRVDPTTAAPAPPTAAPSLPPSARPTTTAPKATPSKKKTTKPKPKPKVPTTAPDTSGSVLDQVLAHINAARKDEGLKPFTLDAKLSKAAALHNQVMIQGCGLSHQCSGEGGIGDRFSAQGVKWSGAAENIGYGSSGAGDSAQVEAANGLTDSMLAETPPNDGHRKNLLNPGLARIGLSIVRDGKGVTWMTQDFVN
ncbi:CAP domain-containing protein [Actinoplanes sp. LDG1-01]|uniref:CAP domain-containing protein n=1 Tax=Paractinoplanes lichenicola TaxID=2802976 RepID=A0ABS1W6A6_9ACTN|nr:CAP domain-containing protein [Actinoplanes lichenicola]